jgi:hypothetical protein
MPTYPPPPRIAAQLGLPGNPACTCPTPLASLLCPFGHLTECHQGQSCEAAQCFHWHRAHRTEERAPCTAS